MTHKEHEAEIRYALNLCCRYLDDLDFWADKELNARLALQKAEAEMNTCAARRSKALAQLAEYIRALEAKPKDVQS